MKTDAIEKKKDTSNTLSKETDQDQSITGSRVGIVVAVEQDGTVIIDHEENPYPPLSARSIVDITAKETNRHVLINFEKKDPKLPIIVGLLKDIPHPPDGDAPIEFGRKKVKEIVIDGETIVFNAKKEILLRCGRSSILLRKDGKIVIQGENVTSQANCINQLLGSRIAIN